VIFLLVALDWKKLFSVLMDLCPKESISLHSVETDPCLALGLTGPCGPSHCSSSLNNKFLVPSGLELLLLTLSYWLNGSKPLKGVCEFLVISGTSLLMWFSLYFVLLQGTPQLALSGWSLGNPGELSIVIGMLLSTTEWFGGSFLAGMIVGKENSSKESFVTDVDMFDSWNSLSESLRISSARLMRSVTSGPLRMQVLSEDLRR
jgi:hypothetical protein